MEKQGHYLVATPNHKFGASILYDEYCERHIIRFGGRKECITLSVYNEGPFQTMLTGISYDEKCSLEKLLERGKGTEIMLKVALKFTFSIFASIEMIYFVDDSHIQCKKNYQISLALLSIAKHGSTWYQRRFSSIPEKPKFLQKLATINARLDGAIDLTFKEFDEKYLSVNKNIKNTTKEGLRYIYESSNTYRTFINVVHQEAKDCLIFKDWLPRFIEDIETIHLHDVYFVIERGVIESWRNTFNVSKVDNMTFEKMVKPVVLDIQNGGGEDDELFDKHFLQKMKSKHKQRIS